MFRRLALLLIAFSLTLAPLWASAPAAHTHQAMTAVSPHGSHDHCDQTGPAAQPLPDNDCAACPCAVGVAASTAETVTVPVVFASHNVTQSAELPPRGHGAAPPPRPPRA